MEILRHHGALCLAKELRTSTYSTECRQMHEQFRTFGIEDLLLRMLGLISEGVHWLAGSNVH